MPPRKYVDGWSRMQWQGNVTSLRVMGNKVHVDAKEVV